MKRIALLFCGLFLLFSCAKKENLGPKDVETAASLCLKSMDYDFPRILAKSDITKHTSIDEGSFKQDIYNSKGTYGTITYTWKSDRPDLVVDINGTMVPYPDRNTVQFKFLSFYEQDDLDLYSQESILSLFDTEYKKLSDEEVARMKANLETHYANDPVGLGNAMSLLELRLQFNYTRMDNLGDRAYWSWNDKDGLRLNVLSGTATFTLITKMSTDPAVNLPVAVAVAREILSKCD